MKKRELILIGLILITLAAFIYVYLPGYSRYQDLSRQEDALLQEIAQLKESNEQLELEFEVLQDDVTYLEKVMRDEMGLAKPGEEIYKVIEEEDEPVNDNAELLNTPE